MSKRVRYSLVAVAGALATATLVFGLIQGCGSRPRAPALTDDPVYHNAQAGFRFVVPEGWKIHARGEFPQQEMKKERLLVEYRQIRGDKILTLLVSMVDLPEGTLVLDYLINRLHPKGMWKASPPEPLRIGDVAAERLVLQTRLEKTDIVREVVAVRKGGRVYFFSGSFPAGDATGREEIRKALASLTWER